MMQLPAGALFDVERRPVEKSPRPRYPPKARSLIRSTADSDDDTSLPCDALLIPSFGKVDPFETYPGRHLSSTVLRVIEYGRSILSLRRNI
jgi:hypothetical protein